MPYLSRGAAGHYALQYGGAPRKIVRKPGQWSHLVAQPFDQLDWALKRLADAMDHGARRLGRIFRNLVRIGLVGSVFAGALVLTPTLWSWLQTVQLPTIQIQFAKQAPATEPVQPAVAKPIASAVPAATPAPVVDPALNPPLPPTPMIGMPIGDTGDAVIAMPTIPIPSVAGLPVPKPASREASAGDAMPSKPQRADAAVDVRLLTMDTSLSAPSGVATAHEAASGRTPDPSVVTVTKSSVVVRTTNGMKEIALGAVMPDGSTLQTVNEADGTYLTQRGNAASPKERTP
jgi:hypothetical protein